MAKRAKYDITSSLFWYVLVIERKQTFDSYGAGIVHHYSHLMSFLYICFSRYCASIIRNISLKYLSKFDTF